jgi:hypothetical protein
VQAGVASHPIDMVAVRVPCEQLRERTAADTVAPAAGCIWVNGGPESQALILSRSDSRGQVQLRYVPIANLAADASGVMEFDRRPWQAGFPLRIFEASEADLPPGAARAAWLSEWHSDLEWLRALHRTHYSNAIVGLYEQMIPHSWSGVDASAPGLSDAERLRRRYRARQRELVEPDLLIMASDHWNFDVRGFNPGGNHGSFFRPSTHATFMLAGGKDTGIRQGFELTAPYDSLSFVPTMLSLMGRLDADNQPDAALRQLGFRRFPGRVVREIVDASPAPGEDGDFERAESPDEDRSSP